MSRALVVCCDGTWDQPRESSHGRPRCTNVYKLWRGLASTDASGQPQLSYYHEGVGTAGPLDHLFGGIFGAGLARNVLDCYRWIALNYVAARTDAAGDTAEDGDRIYLVGFSHGAYTARSVAGMIATAGSSPDQTCAKRFVSTEIDGRTPAWPAFVRASFDGTLRTRPTSGSPGCGTP